ncbi:hypothetical protein [Bacillus benzoevorans]|uniref:Uncharacterized protein n=1 Tax=Bacillus benzoevorans TaxID=1456 RepID=A0A7X0HTA4_9BACI|nr:hypothetical protein [Bacillus benzoevorans]MBB6446452.1 hypothetical protein [Bacillus benzoevorans]
MIDLSREGFTHTEIVNMLHGAKQVIDFRFELVTKDGIYKKDLKNIKDGSVDFDASVAIKRTASFTMTEDDDINYLSDRIRPFVRFFIDQRKMMPASQAFLSSRFAADMEKQMIGVNGWMEFALGEFLLTSPSRVEVDDDFEREVEAYDATVILQEDKFEERWFIPSGLLVRDAVIEILESSGITRHDIQVTTMFVGDDIEFDIGKKKLEAVNEILRLGNYTELYTDEYGNCVAKEYINPILLNYDYEYKTDRKSVVSPGYEEIIDYYKVPNKFIVIRSLPDRNPLVSRYTNNNPLSPTSTVSRGRTIVADPIIIESVQDQMSLDLFVERIAFEQSQVFSEVIFETGLMPFHGYRNVLNVEFDGLLSNGKFMEQSWSTPFDIGGKMKHTVKRIIEI